MSGMIVIPASLSSDFIHMAGMTIHIALESTIHIAGIREYARGPTQPPYPSRRSATPRARGRAAGSEPTPTPVFGGCPDFPGPVAIPVKPPLGVYALRGFCYPPFWNVE